MSNSIHDADCIHSWMLGQGRTASSGPSDTHGSPSVSHADRPGCRCRHARTEPKNATDADGLDHLDHGWVNVRPGQVSIELGRRVQPTSYMGTLVIGDEDHDREGAGIGTRYVMLT